MTEVTPPILLVEDSEDDAILTRRALNLAGVTSPIVLVETGPAAIDYLSGTNQFQDRARFPLPAVVLLDLKLPMMSGHEVLSWIRSQRHLEGMPVVVLTSSSEPSDLRRSYSLGANSYLVKPLTTRQLLDLAKAFQWPWLKPASTATATARAAVA